MSLEAFTGWVQPSPPTQSVATITVADSPYAVRSTDQIIACTTSGGAITVDLPPASSSTGRSIEILDLSGNAAVANITVQPDGTDTINGAGTYTISDNYSSVTVVSTGTEWIVSSSAGIAPSGGGGLVLIETKLLAPGTLTTTFSGLDGDTDAVYILQGSILIGALGAMSIRALVNGDSAGANYSVTAAATFGSPGGISNNVSGASPWLFNASTFASGSTVDFSMEIGAARTSGATSLTRTFQGSCVERNGATIYRYLPGAAYTSSAANMTSLVIDNNATPGGFGGRISLYQLTV